MSDVSSSPSSSTTEPGTHAKSQGPPHHGDREKGEHVDQSGTDGRLEIDRDVVDPASSTSINNSEDVLLQNDVQDQSAPAAFQNGVSSSVPNLSAVPPAAGVASPVDTAAKPAQPLSAPQIAEPLSAATDQAVTPSIAIPKVRLPHDRVGILEDRIKEDPRGDLEAWQNLVGEHRKRGKIEDARKVYERFIAVFPSAVSTDFAFIKSMLIIERPSNGLPTHKWRTSRRIGSSWRRSFSIVYYKPHISSSGPCTLTTFDGITIPQLTRPARLVKLYTKRMSLLFKMLVLTKTLASCGRTMFSL